MPLSTYLPDGDIDLTVLSHQSVEDLATDIYSILKREEENGVCFQVKDVHYINAQVKLVKCIVQNIAVDISFNQNAGLQTVYFLEHVMYTFLNFYGSFNWDTCCVTVIGPVSKSSLEENSERTPVNGDDLLLFNENFLRNFVDPNETSRNGFQIKFFNIVDPLKKNNNLGRSINQGNAYRIKSAFSYGAEQLTHVLKQPVTKISEELNKFFNNTLSRSLNGQRQYSQAFPSAFGSGNVAVQVRPPWNGVPPFVPRPFFGQNQMRTSAFVPRPRPPGTGTFIPNMRANSHWAPRHFPRRGVANWSYPQQRGRNRGSSSRDESSQRIEAAGLFGAEFPRSSRQVWNAQVSSPLAGRNSEV